MNKRTAIFRFSRVATGLLIGIAGAAASAAAQDATASAAAQSAASSAAAPLQPVMSGTRAHLDRSGRKRTGKASVYAQTLARKTMADGAKLNPGGANAASKTLPLGTTAMVTNLETGKSAIVTIEDRGPYAKGRIIDLSPATADQIGLSKRKGVTKVEVVPITLAPIAGSAKSDPATVRSTND